VCVGLAAGRRRLYSKRDAAALQQFGSVVRLLAAARAEQQQQQQQQREAQAAAGAVSLPVTSSLVPTHHRVCAWIRSYSAIRTPRGA
jgi:small-conductance mechanosensitive channel